MRWSRLRRRHHNSRKDPGRHDWVRRRVRVIADWVIEEVGRRGSLEGGRSSESDSFGWGYDPTAFADPFDILFEFLIIEVDQQFQLMH